MNQEYKLYRISLTLRIELFKYYNLRNWQYERRISFFLGWKRIHEINT